MIEDEISIYLFFDWDGIGIYLIFNRDIIGIKKGSWDGTRIQPVL
jgi:hypothetical protein